MTNHRKMKKEKDFLSWKNSFPFLKNQAFIVIIILLGTMIGCGPTKKQYQINEALLIDQTRVLENEVYRTRFLLKKSMEENERLRQELGVTDNSTELEQNVPIKRNSSLNVSVSPSYRMQSNIMTNQSGESLPNHSNLPTTLQNSQSLGTEGTSIVPGSQFVPQGTLQLPLSQNRKTNPVNRRKANQSGRIETAALLPNQSTNLNEMPGVLHPVQPQTAQNNSTIWQLDPSTTQNSQVSKNSNAKPTNQNNLLNPSQNKESNSSAIQNPVYQQSINQNIDAIRLMNYQSSFSNSEEIPWSPIRQ